MEIQEVSLHKQVPRGRAYPRCTLWAETPCHSHTMNICKPCTPSTGGLKSLPLEEPSIHSITPQTFMSPCVCQADKGTMVSQWNRQP